MGCAGGFAVDLYLGIRHAAIEDDLHHPTLPVRRHLEAVLIQAFFVTANGILVQPIIEFSEALQLPVRRYGDGGPFSRITSRGTKELPVDGVVAAGTREKHPLGSLGPGEARQAKKCRYEKNIFHLE